MVALREKSGDRAADVAWLSDSAQSGLTGEHRRTCSLSVAALLHWLTGASPTAAECAPASGTHSGEFTALWADHEIGIRYTDEKRMLHPELGSMKLHCQMLLDPDQSQSLLVYTATPGTQDYEKLQLLSVIGNQSLSV